jgi:hypothetical protein
MILVLQNNKSISKSDDIYCLSTLDKLFKLAKNERSLFESISKRIKTISTIIIKNQINLNQTDRYEEIARFIIEILK